MIAFASVRGAPPLKSGAESSAPQSAFAVQDPISPWLSGSPVAVWTTLVIAGARSAGKLRERGSWTMCRPSRLPGVTCSGISDRTTSPFTAQLLLDHGSPVRTPPRRQRRRSDLPPAPNGCQFGRGPPCAADARLHAMDVDRQIERILADGEPLAVAAESGSLDARVPGCPDWDVEMLLRHTGDVHRWAATIVRERLPERLQRDFEGPAGPEGLLAWYRDGCATLIETLQAASPDDTFWFWGPAPNALAFWARRQANETAVHRCDAESARGPITPLTTVDALDAIDEWFGLGVRRARAPAGGGGLLRLGGADAGTPGALVIGG